MKTILVSLSSLLFVALQASAQKSPVYISSGVAANGYDVVSYFKESAAVKGDKKFTYHSQNADWQFSTIVDGKLYLNYNGDVNKKWTSDRKALIDQANEKWPKIRDKE